MKANLVLVIVGLAAASTAGCASMEDKTGYVAPRVSAATVVEDDAYVARVEQLAKRRGVNVVWVNPPKKHVQQVASVP